MKLLSSMLSASTLTLILASTPAFGQTADAATEDADSGEIVVTAQKRSENIQTVPISIAAFSGETLTRSNVVAVTDLARLTPNFSATRAQQTSNLRLTIRGIGSASNSALEPSVASFIDGVYIPRPGSLIGNFLDMEGVEVLRGPQGTLFGRNASVGALSLHTASPKPTFSAAMTAEYGSSDRYKVNGYVNAPLSDNVSLRVAGLGQWFKGYWTNRLDGRTFGGTDDAAGRASLKADLGSLTWTVRADYSQSRGSGFPNTDFDARSVSAAQLAFLTGAGLLPDTNLQDRRANQYLTDQVNDRQWGVSSDASLDLGGYTLRLIDSYRNWKNDQTDGDVIFTPVPLASRFGAYRSTSHNHELQFISPKDMFNGHLDFVAGLYYFQEDFKIVEQLQMNSQFCNFLVPAGPRPVCNASLVNGVFPKATDLQFAQNVKSYAAYGQANVGIADGLKLVLGGRYTKDDKAGSFVQVINSPFVATLRAPENIPLVTSGEKFTWRAGLNYQPTRDVLLYASVSTGYKSGGFNSGGGVPALGQKRVFAPETVKDYEFGVKSTWLDGALKANLNVYLMDIDGYQDRSFDGVSFVVRNAGSLRQQGFEFDTVLAPTRNFSVSASLAYLDSKFTSFANASALPGCGSLPAATQLTLSGCHIGATVGIQDLTGARNNFAPEFTGSLAVDWKGELGGSGMSWALNGNLAFVSDINVGGVTDNNPQTTQDGYVQLGARATLNGPDSRWSLSVFGTNLTDQYTSLGNAYQVLDGSLRLRNGVFPGSTAIRPIRGDPRTYGVSATVRF